MSDFPIECVTDTVNIIGEGPAWIRSEQALYWVDVGLEPKTLLRYSPSSQQTTVWQLPYRASAVRERASGGLLITFQRALAIATPGPLDLHDLPVHGVDFDQQRFNDSAVDPLGRLWIGTYDRSLKQPLGELYCIDSTLQARSVDHGFMMSNGIAISPDTTTLYHTDSRPHGVIYAWDFDCATGSVANRRVFLDFASREGRPDGCAMDSEGCLWVAEIDAGRLLRVDPKGQIIRSIALPVRRPTSLAFGGADLNRLYITSMTFGVSASDLAHQPLAGRLLVCDPGVRGLPQPPVTL